VKELLSRLPERVGREVPEAQVIMRELLQGPPVDAPIEYRIQGPDIEELRRLGDELRERLARVPVITHSTASLTAGSPKLWLEPDEAEARLAGVGLVELATQMNRYLEGVPAGSVLEATEELPVRVRVDSAGRGSVSAVGSIPVRSSIPEHRAGPGIPLDALGELELKPILDFIPHRDGTRVNIIRGYTRVGVYPETALTQLRTVLDDDPVEAPRGYHIETGGDAEERGDAMSNLFASVPVLALLMVATVALSLRSFRLGGVVLAVAVCSVGLGLASLSLLGHPLGFQAIIGLIGLVGVAINAAIIINASLRTDPRAIAGSPAAIRHVVTEETSRHIVSTTITTFGGFLPLILSSGGFWPPFATGIAGGVLLSTLVSFYFVPAAFLLITRRRPVERPRELSRATTAEVVP
jgi:multidrug efflux pump subunit AcrB